MVRWDPIYFRDDDHNLLNLPEQRKATENSARIICNAVKYKSRLFPPHQSIRHFTGGPVRQIGAFAPVRQPIRTCMVKADESHVSRVAVASPLS
jgi:hypothetical protein